MDFNQYYQRVEYNRATVEALDGERYPNTKKVLEARNEQIKKRLLFIFERAQQDNQEGGQWGYWFFMPLSRFVLEGAELGRQKSTWEKTIILLACLGMIEREIPTEDSATTPYRQAAVQYAKEHGHDRATAFISVPMYTDQQLEYIEGKAKRWIDGSGNFNHFTKSTIIDVFGNAVADRVFQDQRKKPRRTIEAERRLIDALGLILDTEQFITKEMLFIAAASKDGATTQPQLNAIAAAWERAGKRILKTAGAVHHRPTNQEKELYGLEGNGWIITKGVDNDNEQIL